MSMRVLLMCPGRGSYSASTLGSLQVESDVLDWLDAFRNSLGRASIRDLDAALRVSAKKHVAGENASLLTFAATAADLECLDPDKTRVVAVAGNSMGWYSALYASGALELDEAARLIETMGAYQAGNVLGGQVLYPVCDEEWRPSGVGWEVVNQALEHPEVHLSIKLGGSVVLAGEGEGLRTLMDLPPVKRGTRSYPLKLPLHSAFHSPVMRGTSERALGELADLALHSPGVPLVDGTGRVHQPWASADDLLSYTLVEQVLEPYDFTASVRSAMGEFAPDAVLLPGPGDTLGAPVAQALISCGWRGLRDKQDFFDAQSGPRPVVLSMAREDQRALCVLS